jgi:succinate dehydrogenase / fumarate reductase flavoprotein subunit
MRIFPGVHYSMGGMWIDVNHMTNIPGLFAAGEVEYQYHGANRLGANSLLSCIYGGKVAAPVMKAYADALDDGSESVSSSLFDQARRKDEAELEAIFKMDGNENGRRLQEEMGSIMTNNVTVVRHNDKLNETDQKLVELQDRWKEIGVHDRSRLMNQEVVLIRQLRLQLELARVVTQGALRRDESRGAHFKPEFPDRNDADFLKTTKAKWSKDGPIFEYEDVDTSLIPPRARKYDVDKKSAEKRTSSSTSATGVAHA